MKKYLLRLEPLTCIHIGTGKELNLLDYYLEGDYFINFTPEKIVSSLDDDALKVFYKMIDDYSNYKEFPSFFIKHMNENAINYKIKTSEDFQNKYQNKKNSLNNALNILETIKNNADFRPLIPGSTIKGSIRTAFLNQYVKNLPGYLIQKPNKIEEEIVRFGKLDFSKLLIRDTFLNGIDSLLVAEATMFHNNDNLFVEKMNLVNLESVLGKYFNKEVFGESELLISNKFSISNILKSCNSFYINKFKEEKEMFFNYSKDENFVKFLKVFEKDLDAISQSPDSCVLKIGRFSHFNYMTLDRFRDSRHLRKGVNKTRTVIKKDSCPIPFGWVKMVLKG